jgi:hypothetical protein
LEVSDSIRPASGFSLPGDAAADKATFDLVAVIAYIRT